MATRDGRRVIAIEEHYFDEKVVEKSGAHVFRGPDSLLGHLGETRLAEMDAAGIDMQVLSHAPSGVQTLDAESAVAYARSANDRLAAAVAERPDRFAAFATLPTPEPKAAAAELERAVSDLGFKGAMLHGLTGLVFHDDKRFWPIFERARALDVPVYIHPGPPHPAVVEAYYKDYAKDFPGILNAGWGFTVEIATAGIRLVLSGVFDAYPGLKIIIGHLGEGLPFSLWRIDHALSRPGNRGLAFREIFREHVWITTSGNFSDSALLCSVMELGVDRILFSVDWPYVESAPGVAWMERVPLSTEDREKILNGNATRLLRL